MPPKRTNPKGYEHVRRLRQDTTPEEKLLWEQLRRKNIGGIRFRRQHAIGEYVVDFCAPRAKLVVELDGEPHKEHVEYDQGRTEYLQSLGYTVIRFWNGEVIKNIQGILQEIKKKVDGKKP